jgi:branched-chain amino acid aminotransferase
MTNTYYPYTFFAGKTTKIEDANVPIMTNALQYGTAFFGGIRGYYLEDEKALSIFRLEDHYERFTRSAQILGVSLAYTPKELVDITVKLARKNKPKTNCYFRPFAFANSTSLTPNLAQDSTFDFALYMMPLAEYLPIDKGLRVCVSSWQRISDNSIPARGKIAGGYINSALARTEAAQRGYDEAILLNSRGVVAEGSAENIFIVRKGTLITPPPSDDILEGITRNTVLTLAKELLIPYEERSITRSELYVADEIFFSGTGVQIAWISNIDNRTISSTIGPVTKQVREQYFKAVNGKLENHLEWCTLLQLTT